MARKARIEYAGARYHVMSRGNRREYILGKEDDKSLFMDTLEECCGSRGWIIHAYVLMGNHFHLLLETPEPSLSDGMRWLQGTYGGRYNRRHGLVGHVWAGRFKAPVISDEGDDHFLAVSQYIHLNPAEAGLLNEKDPKLKQYKWSSFPGLCAAPSRRPAWLCAETTMKVYQLPDDTAGSRRKYQNRIEILCRECVNGALSEADAAIRSKLLGGWYIGDESFGNRLQNKLEASIKGRKKHSLSGGAVQKHDAGEAKKIIRYLGKKLGISPNELKKRRYNDWEKQMITALLRIHTGVSYDWIIDELCMGSRASVYNAIVAVKKQKDRRRKREWEKLKTLMNSYH